MREEMRSHSTNLASTDDEDILHDENLSRTLTIKHLPRGADTIGQLEILDSDGGMVIGSSVPRG
jgi:hypothetical protein